MSIIKNYGFRWDRKHLYRGAGRNKGDLVGRARGQLECDFREQIGVYVLYDATMRIIYVGQAGRGQANLFKRLTQHEDDHLAGRWTHFSWIGFRDVNKDGKLSDRQSVDSTVSGFTYSEALDEIEGVLIELIEPTLNRQSGKLRHATEYHQEHLDYVTLEMVREQLTEIEKALKSLKKP